MNDFAESRTSVPPDLTSASPLHPAFHLKPTVNPSPTVSFPVEVERRFASVYVPEPLQLRETLPVYFVAVVRFKSFVSVKVAGWPTGLVTSVT